MNILGTLVTGLVLGMLFAVVKLPIPAPPTIAGAAGVVGLTIGFILTHNAIH